MLNTTQTICFLHAPGGGVENALPAQRHLGEACALTPLERVPDVATRARRKLAHPEFLHALTRARGRRKLTPEKRGDAPAYPRRKRATGGSRLTPKKRVAGRAHLTRNFLHADRCALENPAPVAVCKPRFPWPQLHKVRKTTPPAIQRRGAC